jgi:hypothetical protein
VSEHDLEDVTSRVQGRIPYPRENISKVVRTISFEVGPIMPLKIIHEATALADFMYRRMEYIMIRIAIDQNGTK